MEFKPKSPEQIQAQVEHFADKGVKECSYEQSVKYPFFRHFVCKFAS